MFRKLISQLNSVERLGKGLIYGHVINGSNKVFRRSGAVVMHQHRLQLPVEARSLHISSCRFDLMEFFDDKKNWGEHSIRHGRSWKVDELRIKSNTDLHKLWYVLLKERNMLLTMEEEAKQQCQLFPSPERIDKVEESMKNLETVVRERNRAFHELEVGNSGERPGAEQENFLGLQEYRQFEEHTVPKELNKPFLIAKRDEPKVSRREKSWFLIRWKEKQRRERRKELRRQQFEVIQTLQKFPNVDVEALREKYPDVKVDRYVERFLKDKIQGNLIATH